MTTKASNIAQAARTVDASGNVDGDTLDNLDSSQFLRSDTNDTMTGNLDVQGTVTADGLTVASGGTSGQINVHSTTYSIQGGSAFGDMRLNAPRLRFYEDGTTLRLNIENGNISFYEDTGTTAKFFWDAADEHLYIGDNTSNMPTSVTGAGLMVSGTSPTGVDGGQLVIKSSETTAAAGNGSGIVFDNYNGVGNRVFGAIQVLKENSTHNNSDSYMRFTTRNNSSGLAEAMRIDSNGNLLVGKQTADSGATAGVEVAQDGLLRVTRSTSPTAGVAYFNKLGDEGKIVDFRKDGSIVGSIGAAYTAFTGRIYIGTGDTGVGFNSDNDCIDPMSPSARLVRQDAISLGRDGNRFKDLYLSGTVHLGSWDITEDGSGNLLFSDGGINKMRLNADGSLDVAGDINANATL